MGNLSFYVNGLNRFYLDRCPKQVKRFFVPIITTNSYDVIETQNVQSSLNKIELRLAGNAEESKNLRYN